MNMYKYYPLIKSPTDPTKIWQYMDLSEFIHLLYSKSLFFCNTRKFGDPFEGSLPEFNNIDGQKEYPTSKDLVHNKKKFQKIKDSNKICKKKIIISEVQYLNYRHEWLKKSLRWDIFLTKKRPYEYE